MIRKLFTFVLAMVSLSVFSQESMRWLPLPAEWGLDVRPRLMASEHKQHRVTVGTDGTGTYYQRPEGAFYQGMSADGWSYYPVTKIVVKPWETFLFRNRCANAQAAKWSVEGKTVTADSDGNLPWTTEPLPVGYVERYLPTIAYGGENYTLGEGNKNWSRYKASLAWADSVVALSVCDPGRVIGTVNGVEVDNFRPLSMVSDFKYNFGSMAIVENGTTYYCRGVRQRFEKPMGPLWVDNIVLPAISHSLEPIASGRQLTLTLRHVASGTDSDGVGDAFYTMNCVFTDVLSQGTMTVNGETLKLATLLFSRNSPTDTLLINEPFVLEIEGFDQDGVDVGLAAALIDPCDKMMCEGSSILLHNSNHEPVNSVLQFNDRVPCVSIRGMYDGLQLVSSDEKLTQKAPDNGGELMPVELKTAIWWHYGTPEANYELEGLPDWLTATVDESRRDINGNKYGHGLVTLSLSAAPLSAGTVYRRAEIYVKGKGVSTAVPIVVEQGEPSGITSLIREGHPNVQFTPAGIKRTANTRGVAVEKGKKVLN